jgi:hypothetical protein
MISVLVCSVKPDLYQQLAVNIEETIGIGYELLCFDNRKANRGICEVYNLLAEKAKYNLLLFVHEDVLFRTNNWGRILCRIFSENKIGVLGVAGCKYKSLKFSSWFTGIRQLDCANIVHQFPERQESIYLKPEKGKEIEEVVCIDGVFMSCSKEVWSNVKFGEQNLKGFHFYDIDFSTRAAKIYRVAVTYEIGVTHITHGGDFGDRWVEAAFVYHKQMSSILPFTKEQNVPNKVEMLIANHTLDFLKNFSISFKNKCKWVWKQRLWLYPQCYYNLLKFFLYKPLGLKSVHKFFKKK